MQLIDERQHYERKLGRRDKKYKQDEGKNKLLLRETSQAYRQIFLSSSIHSTDIHTINQYALIDAPFKNINHKKYTVLQIN